MDIDPELGRRQATLTTVQLGEVDAGMDYVTDVDYVRSADGIRALTAAGFTQP